MNASREATEGSWIKALSDLEGAYAEATIRAYRQDFRSFVEWCEQHGASPLPASPEAIVDYIESLDTAKPATISRRLCGISRVHRSFDYPDPTRGNVVRLARRRIMRTRDRRQKQAFGMRASLRDTLIAAWGTDLLGTRNRALIALGYDTLCRRSELVALRADDISRDADGSASVLIRRSKTDQTGEGRLAYISPATLGLLDCWLQKGRIRRGPIFRPFVGKKLGAKGIHAGQVVRILKCAATAAGLDARIVQDLSGHSMRVGAALDMVECGIELIPVMHAGGWKSANMVLRYTQQIQLAKSGMAILTSRTNANAIHSPEA